MRWTEEHWGTPLNELTILVSFEKKKNDNQTCPFALKIWTAQKVTLNPSCFMHRIWAPKLPTRKSRLHSISTHRECDKSQWEFPSFLVPTQSTNENCHTEWIPIKSPPQLYDLCPWSRANSNLIHSIKSGILTMFITPHCHCFFPIFIGQHVCV